MAAAGAAVPRVVRLVRMISERHEAAPRRIAGHVDVHVVVGPVALLAVVVERVGRLGEAVPAARSGLLHARLLAAAVTGPGPLAPRATLGLGRQLDDARGEAAAAGHALRGRCQGLPGVPQVCGIGEKDFVNRAI